MQSNVPEHLNAETNPPPLPTADTTAMSDQPLRRDVRMLGHELGHVLRRHAPAGLYDLVEQIRELSKQRRSGDAEADAALRETISSLDEESLGELIRALACFFDLANLAEDRHRIRVLRERERSLAPAPQAESIGAAIVALKAQGLDAAAMQALLDKLDIELVFTAHPTEAKRRTVRNTLNRLREDLMALDRPDLLPREREALLSQIRADLDCLWETDTLQPRKPTVLEEVKRSLFVADSIWQVGPRLYRAMRRALEQSYPGQAFRLPVFLRFGTWIGGDRDGNPYVTAEVTRNTLKVLRQTALRKHLEQCRSLMQMLSVSQRRHPITEALEKAIADAQARWPAACGRFEQLNPNEKYRHWLTIVQYRLEQTAEVDPYEAWPDAAYSGPNELIRDLDLIGESLRANNFHRLADGLLQDWLDRVAMFGFHLARLDIREDARKLHDAVAEVAAHLGNTTAYEALNETDRQAFLSTTSDGVAAAQLSIEQLTPETRETVDLFVLMHRSGATFGKTALGAVIASMTHHPSDVLAMLWLTRLAAAICGDAEPAAQLPVVPLFETIDDLKRSAEILDALLKCPAYAEHVKATGNRQICMIGYSDSTKDGGFLAANWRIHEAQRRLTEAARQHGIDVVFFHGRGGSLGRGGGPAARGILALPPDSVEGKLRVTEQGEVLAERYDDPEVAHRHLEQVTWATLLVSAKQSEPTPDAWRTAMDRAADAAEQAYRHLIDDPGFIDYFQHATPIETIESLPIGSRPSRRQAQRSLSNLRAIPYTFAWTQNRHGLTAHFGLGSGLQAVGDWTTFREMYEHWPLFRGMLDNAELGLVKCDLNIVERYATLVPDTAVGQRIGVMVRDEVARSCEALTTVTGRSELLAGTPWLQRSIRVRNPYVDPLNFIQIELLRRLHAARDAGAPAATLEQLADLLRLSVQGIAAGLRTTG